MTAIAAEASTRAQLQLQGQTYTKDTTSTSEHCYDSSGIGKITMQQTEKENIGKMATTITAHFEKKQQPQQQIDKATINWQQ